MRVESSLQTNVSATLSQESKILEAVELPFPTARALEQVVAADTPVTVLLQSERTKRRTAELFRWADSAKQSSNGKEKQMNNSRALSTMTSTRLQAQKSMCFLLLVSLAMGASVATYADGIVLWNKLGSESEVLNSAFGPDLQFYSGGGGVDVEANPAYVPGVFDGALTIGPGSYSTFDRVHNVVLNNLDQVLDPNRGTIEAWFYQATNPVGQSHGLYRIFDGGFGLGSDMGFDSHWTQGLRFLLTFGGTTTVLTSDITAFNGTWIHVAGVWDTAGIDASDDKLRLYVNGQVVASSTSATWGSTVGSQADIAGGTDGNTAEKFYVDNLKVFDYARTDFSNRMQEDDGVVPLGLLSIRVSEVELCWHTLTNEIYQLQYSSTLTSNVWLPLGGPLAGNGSGFCTNDVVVAEEPQRFYRLVVTNSP